ncbi:menaquinone-dependent protoporphyrinogen IX dehydrogenase [Ferrimonas gelatinilytica]|uniref:Protoporphyrinogen IX dehydrogenase [quinone] n=1 Tax=Ferrimonas gelatinilytica TaxID=1255257 RepID=A0ABP9SE41_9GAMM
MLRILVLYSTVDGQTRRIAQRLAERLEKQGNAVELAALETISSLAGFDHVVIGASIRYGKYRPALFTFIERHQAELAEKGAAFFSVNLVARKPGKDSAEGNPYIRLFQSKSVWNPPLLGVFAGRLDYPSYGFWDRNIIRFIMWLTKGPTAPDSVQEFTRWDRVTEFADQIAAQLSEGAQ